MPTIADIATGLGFDAVGNTGLAIRSVSEPKAAGAEDLALAMDKKFIPDIAEGAARAAMLPPEADWEALGLEAAIFAPRARYALCGVTTMFAKPPHWAPGVHTSAVVAPDAEIADDVAIGPFCVIEPGAKIGAGGVLLGQCFIGAGAEIGEGALIYQGVRVGARVQIGRRAILHANSVIGADGFSFVTPERGSVESAKEEGRIVIGAENRVWAKIHSLGAVVIGDDFDLGACSVIDRGTVIDTRIGHGVKIDNQVQIGHNVQIGDNCLFCGQSGVAGSAVLGDRVVIGGKAGVADHAKLGSDVMVMAHSGVSGTVKPRTIVGGTPAVPREELTGMILGLRRLPRLVADVAALKKRFSS